MGREVKRVALDFDWPMNEIWQGFLNPHWKKCDPCNGSGETSAMGRLSDLVGLLLLSGADAAEVRCHPYFRDGDGLHHSRGGIPSPDMVELTTGLAGRSPMGRMGHDSCDRWAATAKIIKAAGLSKKWGTCPACKGEGIAADNRKAYKRWKPKEPPSGDGWQMWETTSEGSPVSPVFATPEELAHWLADNGASSFGSSTSTYEQWLAMIQVGWAMSAAIVGGKLMSGVDMAALDATPKATE